MPLNEFFYSVHSYTISYQFLFPSLDTSYILMLEVTLLNLYQHQLHTCRKELLNFNINLYIGRNSDFKGEPYVKNVSEKGIAYCDEFKCHFVFESESLESKTAKQIFIIAGFVSKTLINTIK